MTLGDVIKRRRIELGLTQRDLARALGLNHTAVGHWEVGGGVMLSRLPDLSRVLGIDLRELVSLTPGAGEIISEPEELAVIAAWRKLPVEIRGTLLRGMVASGAVDEVAPAKGGEVGAL